MQKLDKHFLDTNRLTLSLVSSHDAAFMLEILNTKEWLMFIGDRNVTNLLDAEAYIEKIKATPDFYYWVVKNKEDNTSIGIVSLIKRAHLRSFDLGFAFLPTYFGNGFAFEASHCILNFANFQLNLSPLLACTMPSNIASIRLLNRLGFAFERELLDDNQEQIHIYSCSFM